MSQSNGRVGDRGHFPESGSFSPSSFDSGSDFNYFDGDRDTMKPDIPKSRSTVMAEDAQKRRKTIQQELDLLLEESTFLKRQLTHHQEKLDFVNRGYIPARGKRHATDTANDLQQQLKSDQLDSNDGEDANKKRKVEETGAQDSDAPHKSAPTKVAIKTPLMQRLLMGTLKKSQKELERDKTDKAVRIRTHFAGAKIQASGFRSSLLESSIESNLHMSTSILHRTAHRKGR